MKIMYILIIIISQLLFTTSDILGRHFMKSQGFSLKSFVAFWFVVYCLTRILATFGQLYVFSQVEVGKTMALFSATSLILVNILGFMLLGEVLSKQAYIGIMLALSAILVIAFSR